MNRFEWVEYLCCGICMWWIGNETIEPCLWPSHPCPPAACAYKVGHFYHDMCALHGIEHMHSNSTDNDGCWESEYGKLYISSARMAIQKLEGCSWRRINMHPIRKWDRLDVCLKKMPRLKKIRLSLMLVGLYCSNCVRVFMSNVLIAVTGSSGWRAWSLYGIVTKPKDNEYLIVYNT